MVKYRKKTSHKGENGKLLIIGGSDDFPGALILSSIGAFRTGVDNVTVITTKIAKKAINCLLPDVIAYDLLETINSKRVERIIDLTKKYDALLIGPGLGINAKRLSSLYYINKLKVIDADALKAVDLKRLKNSILTPHRSEYDAMLKNSNVLDIKKHINNNIILLKGHIDKIITKNKTYNNRTGNEGMTVNGTGDVLAGVVGGLLAQSGDMVYSARRGAFIVGKVGDALKKKYGYGFMASDILDYIPKFL